MDKEMSMPYSEEYKTFLESVDQLEDAFHKVLKDWGHLSKIEEARANETYPFQRSLDEVWMEVLDWVKSLE